MSKITFIIYAIVGVMCMAGCGGAKSEEMGPAETVAAFCKAMAAGQWEDAEALCDTDQMREYIDGYKEAWAAMEKEGGNIAALAGALIAQTQVRIDDMHREDDKRVVTYTLSVDDLEKTRKATLKKEEKAWRVEKITDAN